MPVTNALLVVSNGVALIQPDPPVMFPGGDFSNLALWSWKDSTVVEDKGTARVTNPNGANARIVQQLTVKPFRQYHISVQVKATNQILSSSLTNGTRLRASWSHAVTVYDDQAEQLQQPRNV